MKYYKFITGCIEGLVLFLSISGDRAPKNGDQSPSKIMAGRSLFALIKLLGSPILINTDIKNYLLSTN
jgi:hypothetical protein